jgi:hypothetical protein
MVAIKAKYDGSKIEVPPQLRQSGPGEVLIVFDDKANRPQGPRPSIWDVFGKVPTGRTAEEINAQVRADRDAWDER